MKKILLLAATIFCLAQTSNAQVPVFPSIASNPANPTFNANDVSYLNKDTAVAVGNNGMSWRSTDGGLNWTVISTFTSTTNNNSVIMTGNYICIAGDQGTVTFSNNRGLTWQNSSQAQPLVDYHGVDFADTTFGVAVGDNGDAVIYHWVGGLGWAHIPTTQTVKLNAAECFKTSTSVFTDGNAMAVGDNGAVSTYAFGSWTNLTPPTTKNINGIYIFPTNDTVLIVGQYGLIMRSPDFGNSWTTLNNSGYTLRDIAPGINPGQFLAVGDSGVIFVSNDGGNTFVENTVGFNTTNLKGVSAKDPKGAFAGSGNVLRVFSSDTVNVTFLNDSVLCPGDQFKLAFDLRGVFGALNQVTIELSDSSGSFATPVNIGSKLNPAPIDTVIGTIPMNAKPSLLYQVRASSSDPSVVSDIYPVTLTVNPRPNNVTVQANFTDLYVNAQTGCTYQWYYNNNPMGTGTDTLVTTTGNGNYYVVVTGSNGCTTTSNTFVYTATGIKNISSAAVAVSPNPVSGSLTLKVTEGLINKAFVMYDALGKKVFAEPVTATKSNFDLSALEPGLYFYSIGGHTGRIVVAR